MEKDGHESSVALKGAALLGYVPALVSLSLSPANELLLTLLTSDMARATRRDLSEHEAIWRGLSAIYA